MCQGIHCDKSHELWFNLQGHLTRFGLQEYAIVTGLHARSFSEGDRYTKALEKRRLKEKHFKSLEKISCAQLEKAFLRTSTPRADRYKLGLALIVEGVIIAPDNNVGIDEDTLAIVDDLELFFAYPWAKVGYRRLLKGFRGTWERKMSDTKMKDVNYTIHEFSIVMQIWAYEAIPELDERFGEHVGERSPRLLCWTSTKQPQQRTYDAFFRDVQLHVHATLRPTEAERDLPYITSLVPFFDRLVQFLDDLARRIFGPQFHETAPASGGDDDIMKFQFLVPENVRLPARISQRSNLKYIKTVMDNFDDRLRADFRDSCLGFLADGHLTRFRLQEYTIITGLHAGSFPEGDRYTKALEKRRLKEKYFKSLEKISCAKLEKALLHASTPRADRYKFGLALIVEGVITAPDNNIGIDEDTLAIVDDLELFFAYPCVKVGFGHTRPCPNSANASMSVWVNARPGFCAEPPPNNRNSVDTMRSSGTYSLVPFPDRPVQFLDNLARKVVGPQFHEATPASGGDDGIDAGDEHDDESGAGVEDVDTSASDSYHTSEGNGEDVSKLDDSGESGCDPSSEIGGSDSENKVDASGRQSGTLPTPVVAPSTSGVQGTRGGVTLTREDMDDMYDQRILFEMRLRTVKLEIMQHVTEEFARLRDFISTLVPPSSGTSTSAAAPVVNKLNLWDDPHEGSNVRSPHDDDLADKAEMQEENDGEDGDKQSPEDDDRTEEGDMQDMNGTCVMFAYFCDLGSITKHFSLCK
ncbi:Hypothetical predicted protein [Olea europaea subsp. europaea]|uniref:DUF1985 domain-containing protein n=1 Tax=Olea europaea subsp. europaea TaxID=158383 RepID=A0A8S0ULP7_OLEEU|nr:Hypothetical predicted protein [Olea europaea subsp. europaea]